MRLSFLIICYVLVLQMFAQQDYALKPPRDYDTKPAKIALYIELGGNAGLYSLNADYIYWYKEKIKASVRCGFNMIPYDVYWHQSYVAEHNFILFKNPHHVECGLGITMQRQFNSSCTNQYKTIWENHWYGTAQVSYRYQKQDDGLFFKAGLTPIFFQKNDCGFDANYYQLWAGVALGVSF